MEQEFGVFICSSLLTNPGIHHFSAYPDGLFGIRHYARRESPESDPVICQGFTPRRDERDP
jgi:hypothetical protein